MTDPTSISSPVVWFAGARVVVHVQAAQSEGRFGIWESEESRGDRLPDDATLAAAVGELGVRIVGPPPALDT